MVTKFGLPFKIALLSFLIAGVGVLGIAYLAYRSADKRLSDHAMANLSDDLKHVTGLLRSDIKDLHDNLQTLSLSPPVSGIMRAIKGGGYDDEENATYAMWKKRLSSRFRAVMEQRPAYTNISFFEVDENRRELVRVSLEDGRIVEVEEGRLQEVCERDCCKDITSMSKGQVCSPHNINYKREDGKITLPYHPLFCVCTPVFDDDNKMFGILRISTNFDILTEHFKQSPPNTFYFIANEHGEYLVHPDKNKCFAFEFGRQSRMQDEYPVKDIYPMVVSEEDYPGIRLPGQELGIVLHLFFFGHENHEKALLLGAVASYSLLRAESINFRNRLIVIVSGIVVILSIITALSTRYITHPIRKLTNISDRIASGEEGVEIPVRGNDEVSTLAHSMRTMLASLAKSREKLIASDKELRTLNESLEQRVADRTSELTKANELLHVEITERKRAEYELSERAKRLQKLSELSMTLTGDPADVFKKVVYILGELFDVHIVCLSEIRGNELYFLSVYVDGEVAADAGKCKLESTPCATIEESKDMRIYDHVAERFPEALFLKKYNAFSYCGFPSLDSDGNVVAIVCLLDDNPHEFSEEDKDLMRIFGQRIGMEIERQRHLNERKRMTDQIEASLKEKEVLLREIHHRVKNNMQVIISMLKLQSRHIKGEEYIIDDILKDSQNRIKAMALVHEKLYQTGNMANVDFQEYTKHLTNGIFRSFGSSVSNIELKVGMEDINLEIDTAILCGLIINELISNSLKHAFPSRSDGAPAAANGRGEIAITMRRSGDLKSEFELLISDNGVGVPEGLDFKNTKTLGLYLVNTLVKQLNGEVTLSRSKGTEFQIKFREMKYQERV
jgi:two-component sensor histidine kinase/HAMP domain-containing protein